MLNISPLVHLISIPTIFLCVACNNELNFTTGSQEVFIGELIDADFIIERPSNAPELLASGTTMELQLNMTDLDGQPGTVSTSDGFFDDVALVMLPEITCDRLSALEIPGNFLRSLVFLAPSSSPELNGADAVLFVSLGQNDRVEVRLLAGAGDGRRAFGVFHLTRQPRENE